MDAERWRQVSAWVHRALEMPADDREDFLRRACGDDQELLAEVRSLLAQTTGGDGSRDPLAPIFPEAPSTLVGERMGAFRLEQEIGRGGMGVVYSARRLEGGFDQSVAIKLVRPGINSGEFLARFEHERRVLARLEHPNITRLFDGGAGPDGRPFLVMEYVDGKSLGQFCADHRLNLPGRLALFRQVCGAVGYAHRNLIVHRDLKPGNILVTEDGVPMLLDFGIAKVLHGGFQQPETQLIRLMTALYASPEQREGDDATTSCDIYSLGVILYELLAGRRPFSDHEDKGSGENHLRAARELPPPKLTPAGLGRPFPERVPRDLEAIVFKAIRPEASHRYGSVAQLIADLDRYEQNLPVEACDGTFLYHCSKFLRRRAWYVVATGLFIALALAVVFGVVQHQQREHEERIADQLGALLQRTFESADPTKSGEVSPRVRAMVDDAAEEIDRILDDEPIFKASLLGTLGSTYRKLGDAPRAVELLRESLALRRARLRPNHPLIATSAANLATALRELNHYDEAEALLREAVDNRRQHGVGVALARHLGSLASLLNDRGEFEASLELHRESLMIKRGLRRDPRGSALRSLATGLNNYGKVLVSTRRYAEARAIYDEALALVEELGRNPKASDPRTTRASLLKNYGELELLEGRPQHAKALLQESLAIRSSAYPAGHRKIEEVQDALDRIDGF